MIKYKRSIAQITFLVLWSYPMAWAQTSESQLRFSLKEAVVFALEHNPIVKNTLLDQEIADRQVGEILADGLPQVKLNADLTYNYKIPKTPVTNDFTTGEPLDETLFIPFGADFTSQFRASMSQMIFDGAFFIGLKAAKTFTQLSKKDHVKTQIDVAAAVSKAYFGVLVNHERLLLVARNFSRVDSLLQDTRALHEAGFAEKIDVSRVKVQYNNLKVELDNFQGIVDLTVQLLKFQMGMPMSQPLELTDAIEDISYFDFSLSSSFQYDNRIEYSQLTIRKQLNELDIRNINSRYIPTLDLFVNYGRNTGALEFGDVYTDDWFGAGAVGLRLEMPLFDGMRKRRQVQQRKLKGRKIDNSFERMKYNIDLQIQQSLVNYNREIDRMRAQNENMALAREVYDVSKIKYDAGVGSNIEVIDADAAYKQAQTNYYNALYEALISKIDLQKAYGILL